MNASPLARRWLAAGALLMIVVLTEVVLRVVFGFGNPVLTTRDSDCGYRFKPDQHVYRLFCHNDINQYGMRSPDISPLRTQGRLRFFFIGDSITYGTTFVDQTEIFTSRLSPLLSAVEHQPVEILNQSAGGWAPSNETRYLLANGTFNSHVVVFVLNTGDLGEKFADFPEGNINFPTARPWTAIGEVFDRYVIPRIKGQIFRDAGTTIPDAQQLAEAQASNLELLSKAHDFVVRSHALFVVAYVPFAGFKKVDIDGAEATLARWTAEQHVPFLDVTGALGREDPKRTTFDGMHLRSYGDQVVASEIARQWPTIDAALREQKKLAE